MVDTNDQFRPASAYAAGVKLSSWMLPEKHLHLLGFVSGEIITDNVDLLPASALFNDLLQEGDELAVSQVVGR